MNTKIHQQYRELMTTISKNFPNLQMVTHAYLAAIGTLAMKDCELPITMIACGPSGSGKTEPLTWIMRGFPDLIERADDFTAASFVSHASNVKKKDLEKNDLLPRLKDKCFCTKEMAPILSGREDQLQTNFAKLTSILDGEGLVTSSGTHGKRGYAEKIAFVWLGATTPPKKSVFNLMAQLGTRIFLYSTDFERPTAMDYAQTFEDKDKDHSLLREECTKAIKDFLDLFFSTYPIRHISHSQVTIDPKSAKYLGILCKALSQLRGDVSLGEGQLQEGDRYSTPATEHGWRAAQVMRFLAKSSALIRGHSAVDGIALNFVKHMCLSSMPEARRKVMEAILKLGGRGATPDICKLAMMSSKTTVHYLKELHILGILDGDYNSTTFSFELKEEFKPLLDSEYTGTDQVMECPITQNVPVNGEPPPFDDENAREDWLDQICKDDEEKK